MDGTNFEKSGWIFTAYESTTQSVMKTCINGSYIHNDNFESRKMISSFQKSISRPVTFTKESQNKKGKHL